MVEDTVLVRVPLGDGRMTALRFRRDVLLRHEAEARAEGSVLRDYLARKVQASGIGEEAICWSNPAHLDSRRN